MLRQGCSGESRASSRRPLLGAGKSKHSVLKDVGWYARRIAHTTRSSYGQNVPDGGQEVTRSRVSLEVLDGWGIRAEKARSINQIRTPSVHFFNSRHERVHQPIEVVPLCSVLWRSKNLLVAQIHNHKQTCAVRPERALSCTPRARLGVLYGVSRVHVRDFGACTGAGSYSQ